MNTRIFVARNLDGTWFASMWESVPTCGTFVERRIAFVQGHKSEQAARAAIDKATAQ